MSPTNAKNLKRATRGFTLVELIVGMSLSAIIFAAILSGFTFLGHSLTRLVNTHDQEAKSRRAFYVFAKDISVATQVAGGSDVSLSLKIPASGGTTSTVAYVYDAATGTLTRTDNSSSTVLLTNLTSFDFNYFNGAGTPSTPGTLGVKEVELSFTSKTGSLSSGVQTRYTSVSPRLLLRNKALLQ